jgi:hypothetical protein
MDNIPPLLLFTRKVLDTRPLVSLIRAGSVYANIPVRKTHIYGNSPLSSGVAILIRKFVYFAMRVIHGYIILSLRWQVYRKNRGVRSTRRVALTDIS